MMMQVEIDRLRDRNDSQIFESIRSLLKRIFGRDAFEMFRHDWERNAKLSASMKDFLADHPVITETILESAKRIMSTSDDNTMFTLYHNLTQEASFTDVDAGFAKLVVNVLEVLRGLSSSSYNESNLIHFDRGLGTIWNTENLLSALKIVFQDAVGQERGWLYNSYKSQEREYSCYTYSKSRTSIFFVSMTVKSIESKGWVYNSSSSKVSMKMKSLEFDDPDTMLAFVLRHSSNFAGK
jgi:hypothetical protein